MPIKQLQNGFTLLEILVAVSLFGIIMLTLFSSFNAFTASGRFIADAYQGEEAARLALDRIVGDLTQIYIIQSPQYKKPDISSDPDRYHMVGTTQSIAGRTFSELKFASLGHIRLGKDAPAGIGVIQYYASEKKEGRVDLLRRDILARDVTDDEPDPCRDPVLARNITAFDVSFVVSDGDSAEDWDSDSDENDYRLPDLVEIHLGFSDDEGRIRSYNAAVALPVNRSKSE